jgi:heme-degrading monooxygenase HmoA
MVLKANGFMTCCYFRSVEDIHRFAHSPIHREAWDWWNSIIESHPHLSIMHEVYSAPKKNWENIFINYHLTGIGV